MEAGTTLQARHPSDAAPRPGPASVPAWDAPTRLFKWSLVALVGASWITHQGGDAWLGWHIRVGYATLVLLAFRLLWGVFGSSTARFSHWVPSPARVLRYGTALVRGEGRPYLGHNPLGACMILLLLVLVAGQGVSGLFTADHNGLEGGPFANLDFGDPTPVQVWASRYHHQVFYVLLGFVVLHVAVNLFYQFRKRDPVVAAMVTGTKPARDFADEPAMRSPRALVPRALLCLAAAAAAVLGGVKLAGGTLP